MMRFVLSLACFLVLGCVTVERSPTEYEGDEDEVRMEITVLGDASGVIGDDCITDRSTVEVATTESVESVGDGEAPPSVSASLILDLDSDGAVTRRTYAVTGPGGRITDRRNWSEAEGCAMASGGGLSESAGASTRSWLRRASDILIGAFTGGVLF